MDIKGFFQEAFAVAKLSAPDMTALAAAPAKTRLALAMMGLSALASAVGFVFFPVTVLGLTFRPSFAQVVISVASGFAAMLLMVFVSHAVAQRLFHGVASFSGYLRVVGYGAITGLLSFVPALGIIAALWMLVIYYHVLTMVHRLTQRNAIVALVITLVFLWGVGYALGALGFARYTAGGALLPQNLSLPGLSS